MQLNKFSFSSLNLYSNCPRCYYLKYVCGIKPKYTSSNLVVGKTIHKFLENETLDPLEILENAINDIGLENIVGQTKLEMKDDVERMSACIRENPITREGELIKIAHKELEIFVPIENFVLQVIIDKITDRDEILEHKTSKRKYNMELIGQSQQHNIYELGFRNYFKKRSGGIIYDIIYKSKIPLREQIPFRVTDGEITKTKEWALDIMRRIGRREWTPYKPVPYLHKLFCDYPNLCEWCSKKKR